MKISLTNTSKMARIWEGKTDSGIPVHAYITRIAVAEGLDSSQLESELLQ